VVSEPARDESAASYDGIGTTTFGLRDVNAAERTDFSVHRVADASQMELVAGYAPAKRSTGNQPSPALTATTNGFGVYVGEEAHQGRRKEEGGDQHLHRAKLSHRESLRMRANGVIAAGKWHYGDRVLGPSAR
jgi:hypothetical protein